MCHLQQVQAAGQAVLLHGHVIPEDYVDIISRHYFLDAVAGGSEGEAQTCTLDRTGLFAAWYKYDSSHLLTYSFHTDTQRFYWCESWDLWGSGLPNLKPRLRLVSLLMGPEEPSSALSIRGPGRARRTSIPFRQLSLKEREGKGLGTHALLLLPNSEVTLSPLGQSKEGSQRSQDYHIRGIPSTWKETPGVERHAPYIKKFR